MLAGVAELIHLLHGQRVHVGAQPDGAQRTAIADDAYQAGLAESAMHGDAPAFEQLAHQLRRAVLLERQLRMGMDVAADGADGRRVFNDVFDQIHKAMPASLARPR
ncbi:hypothetical protein D9M70_521550 [compost metagenome]